MRGPPLILLVLLCCLVAIPFVQADQVVPFLPPGNVTGAYQYSQGNDFWEVNTNFPMSSQDVVYPDWLFGMMLAFIVIILILVLIFISKVPAPWVSVIFCGMLIFGLGLAAAEMAPLVGYTEVFHQVIATAGSNGAITLNATNTIYVNEIIVYTMGTWIGYACYGIAVGGVVLAVAGLLLQMKEARRVADAEQAERDAAAEGYQQPEQSIQWRKKDRI